MSDCSGKAAYGTRRAAKRVRRRHPGVHPHLRAYRCPQCRWWHLGTLPPAVLYGLMTADEVYRPGAAQC